MSTADLLFELGTEELPAGEITGMVRALRQSITEGLTGHGLSFDSVDDFSTPRRLAILVQGLVTKGPDLNSTVVGPPLSAAKDESGQWTKAAEGFARKQGVAPEALEIIEEQGIERIVAHVSQQGAEAASVVPDIVARAVTGIPVSKRMRWGRSRDEFLRPVQWLVLLLGDEVLPLSLFNLSSSRESRGHRFHHNMPVPIASPGNYQETLKLARVLCDSTERRDLIAQQVKALAAPGESVALADDLLDEVTGLVEWPTALRGSFDEAFLEVPSQALISAMKTHQKYFHLTRESDGALLPAFITVSNIDSQQPSEVISGNERVIRPRLSDAAFFFSNDKKTPLASRQSRLSSVVFQHKLGSLLDKTERITQLATEIAKVIGANQDITARAAQLSKCDLVSEMVLESPDLQGIAGRQYAMHDGEDLDVAAAIESHYYPRFAGDSLPDTAEAAAVALADRLDTLVGIFGIGQPPTGSKDPFALRRASLAVIRILINQQTSASLQTLLETAVSQHAAELEPDTVATVLQYTLDRLGSWYDEEGVHVSVLRAVLATEATDLFDIDLRVRALAQFAQTETAEQLAAANKRVANILAKADSLDDEDADASLFTEQAETELHGAVNAVDTAIKPLLAAREYQAALDELAKLRDPVDAFFEHVMVNSDNPDEKRNRYRLLSRLRQLFTQLADLALLAAAE